MYIGDTGAFGLSHLVYFLLDAAVAEARGGQLQQLRLSLGEEGSVELLEDGRPVPPDVLPDLLTRLEPSRVADTYEPLRFETLCVFALSEHFELEAWEDARRWHLSGQAGVLREHPTPEPVEAARFPGPRGTRVTFIPDRTLFQSGATLDARRLHLRCRELTGLTPGLSVHFRSSRLEEHIQYPRGLADLVDELTQYTLPQLATPLVAEARWEDFLVRCAVQWTQGPDCQVWSFANTVRTRKGGRHVEGALDALGAAMAQLRRHKKPWSHPRLLPGLTLVVAVHEQHAEQALAIVCRLATLTYGLRTQGLGHSDERQDRRDPRVRQILAKHHEHLCLVLHGHCRISSPLGQLLWGLLQEDPQAAQAVGLGQGTLLKAPPHCGDQVRVSSPPQHARQHIEVRAFRAATHQPLKSSHQALPCTRLVNAAQCLGDGLHDGLPVVVPARLFNEELLVQAPDAGCSAKLPQPERRCLSRESRGVLQHGFQLGPDFVRLRTQLKNQRAGSRLLAPLVGVDQLVLDPPPVFHARHRSASSWVAHAERYVSVPGRRSGYFRNRGDLTQLYFLKTEPKTSLRREGGKRSRWPRSLRRAP
ncbi:hypothetical protein [Hyalangium sp.]|uniref:hypothetical protein n=1 Tax=Hyalangium sp. TaxID=2028555 RepID=UPI0039C8691D